MSKKLLLLIFAVTLSLCSAKSQYFVATPRLIRPGENVKIAVTLTGLTNDVTISVRLINDKNIPVGPTMEKVFAVDPQMSTITGFVEYYVMKSNKLKNAAKFEVKAKGGTTFKKFLNVAIDKSTEKVFIQTDKPIYKPGETIKFRVVAIDLSLLPIDKKKISEVSVTNPGGSRVMQWLDVLFENGMVSLEFPLSKQPVLGIWKLAVKFNGQKTSQTVKVDKYVLPKFEVTVKTPSYILKRQDVIPVTICAKYTYGKDVEGKLNAKICLHAPYRWLRDRLSTSCSLIAMEKIKGCKTIDYDVSDQQLMKNYFYYGDIVVKVDADVTEDATGVTLKGNHTSVRLSKLDVKLEIELEEKYYKPGFPFMFKIKAMSPDGRPTKQTNVILTVRENYKKLLSKDIAITDGVYNYKHIPSGDSKNIRIEAVYRPEKQPQNVRSYFKKVKSLRLNPYGRYNVQVSKYVYPWYSKEKKYLKITDVTSFEIGKKVEMRIKASKMDTDSNTINNILVCKGVIVRAFSQKFDTRKHIVSFPVTEEMSPTCRFLTYMNYKGEFIADYKILRTKTLELKNKASVKFNKLSSKPGEKVKITLKAEPDSKFALSAVDRSVQLLGETNDIRESQVLSVLKGLDVNRGNLKRRSCKGDNRFWGSSSHSGGDGFEAISETGLVYISDMNTDIVPCPPPIYPDIMDFAFGGGIPEGIPEGALPGVPGPRPFVNRQKVVTTVKQTKKSQKEQKRKSIRTKFPETWLWNEYELDPVTGEKVIEVNIPDTITRWYANGLALSPTAGIGIATPQSIKAFLPFFVSLHLPYSVKRGEKVKIPATVFNYLDKCLPIVVSMHPSNDFTIEGDSSTTMCVCGGQSKTFKFNMKPTTLNHIDVTVSAITTSEDGVCKNDLDVDTQTMAQDQLTKKLLVEAEGIKKDFSTSSFFCLDGEIRREIEKVKIELPEHIVEGSVFARMSVVGDLLGPSISGLDKLLAMPFGCGEQNMLKFAPNIYVMDYLTATNQVTEKIKADALRFMQSGYQRELTYKHRDGAYSAFGERDKEGSTWLTAFVLRSYSQAKRYIFIDPKDIRDSMKWLLSLQDEFTGCFKEVGMVHHKEMKGGITSGSTMTAFVLMALIEAGIKVTDNAVFNALKCVKKDLDSVNDAYTAAILAYTLTLAGDHENLKMLQKLDDLKIETESGSLIHWEGETDTPKQPKHFSWCVIPRNPANIEMTAYALMAYSGGKKPFGDKLTNLKILKWLAKQRNSYGGFASTQDTCVGLQSLANYAAGAFTGPYDLRVYASFSNDPINKNFHITDSNKMLLQRTEVAKVPTTVTLEAAGVGCALVQANVKYNVPKEEDIPAFVLTHHIKQHKESMSCKHTLKVCGSFARKGKSNMALIDVDMVSGFEPILFELDMLQQSPEASFSRYEFEDGKLTFYFDEFEKFSKCVSFSIEQVAEVEGRKPAPIKIYDYYDTTNSATKLYSVGECPELNIVT